MPEPDMSEISVKFSTPVNASLAYTKEKAKQINQLLTGFSEVSRTYTTINSGMDVGKHKASIRVLLQDKQLRQRSQQELIAEFRHELANVYGITVDSVTPAKEALGSLKPIQLSLQGNDTRVLAELAENFEQRLAQVPGVIDIESSIKSNRPTLSVHIDREQAADLGLSVSRIAMLLRPLLAGEVVTSWQAPDGENYDFLVRLPENQRTNQEDLSLLGMTSGMLNPLTGQPEIIPLGQVSYFAETQAAAQINRRNGYREVLFSANVNGRPAGDVGADIEQLVASMDWPKGYRLVTQGANKDMAESVGYAKTALLLGMIFIYMLLATQFNSFLHPLTIMMSLPLSLIGVFGALLLFGSSLNMFSIIGIIMLMGLVTKNAILLVDLIQKLIQQGAPREQAISQAGQTRLRPILMTTAAMIAGMVPLAVGLGTGAEQRAPMAHALIGGLITSTLLTLIVVPVVYSYLDDLKRSTARLFARMPVARVEKEMIHLGDEHPVGKDYSGMWYEARLKQGIDDRMLFGVYEKNQEQPIWYYASHRFYDGLAILGEKLLPRYGTSVEVLPRGKDDHAPSLKEWWHAQKTQLTAPKANVQWRRLNPALRHKAVPMPYTFLLNEYDTQRIEERAKAAGVSSTQWLLWTADKALRRILLQPTATSSWVYPVNLRGATDRQRDSMNQCGGFMLNIAPDMDAQQLHQQVRNRMARLDHWSQWWLMSIGRLVGQSGVNLIYRGMNPRPGQFVGSYSNLGAWEVPDVKGLVAAAPCSPSYPVSVTTAVCNGRRSFSVRLHPVVGADEDVSRKVLALWRAEALKAA